MAVLQYVGARYVPVFYKNPNGSWDWEAGVSYEPLTIVKYGENSYTSRSQVPPTVGSPNLNPDYWANTGDYNGGLRELREQVDENSQAVSELMVFKGEVDRNISNGRLRKIVILGDSWGSGGDSFEGWKVNATYYLSRTGIDYTINAASGASFAGGGGNPSYQSLVPEGYEDATDIYIFGGENDLYASAEDEEAAINAFAAKFPDANIVFCFLSHEYGKLAEYYAFLPRMENWLSNADIHFNLSLYRCVHDSAVFVDAGHVNTSTSKSIGYYIYSLVTTGKPNIRVTNSSYYNDGENICFDFNVEFTGYTKEGSMLKSETFKMPSFFMPVSGLVNLNVIAAYNAGFHTCLLQLTGNTSYLGSVEGEVTGTVKIYVTGQFPAIRY